MSRRALYLHIEGMDLAGKSATIKGFLAHARGQWEVRRNTLDPENPIYNLADSLRRSNRFDAEIVGNLYVAALMADVRNFHLPVINTLQDSTILLRSLAYHTVEGTPRIPQVLLDLAAQHPKFDFSFVLTASIEKRLDRLARRATFEPDQLNANDLLVKSNPLRFQQMEGCLVDLARKTFNSEVIDTSCLSVEEVVGIMCSRLPAPP